MHKLCLRLVELSFKAISSALFGILLLMAFVLTAPMGSDSYWGLYRYDYLLLYALGIQAVLLYFKLETWSEAKVIAVFHLMAVVMELFLTHPAIASWQYPQPAHFKLYTVPLFAGFMYSAVGSFLVRSLKLFEVKFVNLPAYGLMLSLALLSYVNFMSSKMPLIPDIRLLLFAISALLFWRSQVHFSLAGGQYRLAMLPVLFLLAFVIWLAENISTFYKIWLYPSQLEAWHMVSWAKLGSWYLLILLSLVLVIRLVWRPTARPVTAGQN
jgi:uncharacterized membrane protein YoaT (DUF817 family)